MRTLFLAFLLFIGRVTCGQVSVSELVKTNCPVCLDSTNHHFSDSFRQLHQLSARQLFPEYMEKFAAFRVSKVYQQQDTLRYFALLMAGTAQIKLALLDEAEKTYQNLLAFDQPINQQAVLIGQIELANIELMRGHFTAALFQYQKILTNRAFVDDQRFHGMVFQNMGLCYQSKDPWRVDSAEYYFRRALNIRETLGDSLELATSYLNLGTLFYEDYRDALAIEYWGLALEKARAYQQLDLLDDLYFNLALLYENQGDQAQALQHYKQYVAYQDSIWNRDRIWALAEQKREFEVAEKQSAIALLEKETELQNLELKRQQAEETALAWVLIAVSILLLLVGVFFVITRRNARVVADQKQHLSELNDLKNQLFSIIGHDLRGPIQSLAREHHHLKQHLSENTQLQPILEKNQHDIDNTYRLLDNLLYWSLSQSSSLFLKFERLDIGRLIEIMFFDLKSDLEAKHLERKNQIPEGLLVWADHNTLKIVFRNLLHNAIKFSPEGGCITVSAECEVDGVRVRFENEGSVIAAALMPDLFKMPAKRAERSQAQQSGTGLGLYLCKCLMDLNGGSVSVEHGRSRGAAFTLHLPTEAVKGQQKSPEILGSPGFAD